MRWISERCSTEPTARPHLLRVAFSLVVVLFAFFLVFPFFVFVVFVFFVNSSKQGVGSDHAISGKC